MAQTWVNSAIVYHIFTMGACGVPDRNEDGKTGGKRILKILDYIPHIKELGCNTVLFSPIFQSSSHGYDTSDYRLTDSRLGTKEDFQRVFSELHNKNIRIMLDGVFNHVGRDFWAFKDLQENLENSKYKDWFYNVNFSVSSPLGDSFSYEMWEGNTDLIKLNLQNEDVCNYLLDSVKMWIEDFNIDGLRLDAADCVDKEFFKKLHTVAKTVKSDFWLMGEIIHGDYRELANSEMLDSTTNYECWKGIYSSHNDKNYFEIAYALNRQFGEQGIYKHLSLYNFLDNHDVSRIATLLENPKDIYNAYTLLFTIPGVPSVYYGSEYGIEGEKENAPGGDKAIRSELDLSTLDNPKLIAHIQKLSELKKNNSALQYGRYKEILVSNQQLIFVRELDDDYVVVCLNCANRPENLNFQYSGRNYQFLLQPHSSTVFPKPVIKR